MYKHVPSFASLWGIQAGGFGVPAGGFSSSESTAAASEIKPAERKSERSNDPSAAQLELEETQILLRTVKIYWATLSLEVVFVYVIDLFDSYNFNNPVQLFKFHPCDSTCILSWITWQAA